jgi:hypothetical protein
MSWILHAHCFKPIKMKKIFQLTSLLILGFIVSCTDDKSTDTNEILGSTRKFSILDVNKFNSLKTAYFAISTGNRIVRTRGNNPISQIDESEISAYVHKAITSDDKFIVNNFWLKLNDKSKEINSAGADFIKLPSNDLQTDQVFGNFVDISALGVKGKMYIPKKIKFTLPNKSIILDNNLNFNVSRQGFDLVWNKDENNTRGVILKLSYDNYGLGESINTINVLDDNGYFRIPSSYLSKIPNNATFNVNLTRGNYHATPDDMLIYGEAVCDIDLVIQ